MSHRQTIDITVLIILLLFLTSIAYYYRDPGSCTIDPVLEQLKRDAIRIDPRAAKLQFFPADESYTEDKQKVFLCLKDEHGNYYPMPELAQVLAHELGHALSNVNDPEHKSPEFNNLHNEFRRRAIALGLFDPAKTVSPTYCVKYSR